MSDSFDLNSGGATKSFSFGPQGSQPGTSVSGTVVDMKEVQETHYDGPEAGRPMFWPNGDPKMQIRVTLQTELRDPANPTDDGKRDVYLNGYKKPHPTTGTSSTIWAVMEAVRNATGGTAMQRGGRLTLQWVSGMGFTGDPRHYVATYAPPAMELGGQQPQQQPFQQGGYIAPVHQVPQQVPVTPQQPQAQQQVWTEQGMVNPATGQIAPQGAPQGVPQPDAAAVAAVRAAGQDPATIWPGYVDPQAQPAQSGAAEPPF